MPIVDISGFSPYEGDAKDRIRTRIKKLYEERLKMPLSATVVTFITDTSANEGLQTDVHVLARLYSKMFMEMDQKELDSICDAVVLILEEEGGHVFNEAFPIPVMAMRGGNNPYRPKKK